MVVIEKVSWPPKSIVRGELENIATKVEQAGISKTAVILVGKVLSEREYLNGERSLLYDPEFSHGYRKGLSHLKADASSEPPLDCYLSANNKVIPQRIIFVYVTSGGRVLAHRLSKLLSNKRMY